MLISRTTRVALWISALALAAGCASPTGGGEERLGVGEGALTPVSGFGTNPANLKMYTYVPAGLGAGAPAVVALHGCSQTAQDYEKAGWNDLADQWKFLVIYAEQSTGNNPMRCFRWYDPAQNQRDAGEPLSIKQMVDAAKAQYDVDPARVYVTGLSAGGAMASTMLAVYPDVFAGGALMAGIPYRCATSWLDMTSCMSPGVDKAPAAWGDLVRGAVPGYAGPRPIVSIWQGSSDAIVGTNNSRELIDQWTNVNGIDAVADATTTAGSATRTEYKDASGQTRVEATMIAGMGHGTAVDPGFAPAGGCGAAGAYILDVNVCSTYQAGLFLGLDAGAGSGSSSGSSTSASSTSASSTSASSTSASSTSAGGSGGSGGEGGSGGSGGEGGSGGDGGVPGATCEEFYDANYYHVSEGRAVRCGLGGSYACAIGSGQQLGLWAMIMTWVRRTGPDYYEAGRCP